MSLTYTEMALLGLTVPPERQADEGRYITPVARETARLMREILADPHWEKFVQRVEALRAEAQAVAKRADRDLLEMVLTPEQYTKAKTLQARGQGAVDAYQSVLEIVDNLIKQGENATASS